MKDFRFDCSMIRTEHSHSVICCFLKLSLQSEETRRILEFLAFTRKTKVTKRPLEIRGTHNDNRVQSALDSFIDLMVIC